MMTWIKETSCRCSSETVLLEFTLVDKEHHDQGYWVFSFIFYYFYGFWYCFKFSHEQPALERTADYSLIHYRKEIVRQLCYFPEFDHPRSMPPQSQLLIHLTMGLLWQNIYPLSVKKGKRVWCVGKGEKNYKVRTYCSAPQCNHHMNLTSCFQLFHSVGYDHWHYVTKF